MSLNYEIMTDSDLIKAYMYGHLTKREQELFEIRIEDDPEILEEIKTYEVMDESYDINLYKEAYD